MNRFSVDDSLDGSLDDGVEISFDHSPSPRDRSGRDDDGVFASDDGSFVVDDDDSTDASIDFYDGDAGVVNTSRPQTARP
eukprot:23757-Pelagococcus_subviridis.AAC.1